MSASTLKVVDYIARTAHVLHNACIMTTTALRKHVGHAPAASTTTWLDVAKIASVEITSEAPGHPIEGALLDDGTGWRAGTPGRQTIRIVFDEPQRLERIALEFEELAATRTQEIALDAVAADGERQNIVRQRWNFSPAGSTREVEDYHVARSGIHVLEVVIEPDVGNASAIASLQRLRLR